MTWCANLTDLCAVDHNGWPRLCWHDLERIKPVLNTCKSGSPLFRVRKEIGGLHAGYPKSRMVYRKVSQHDMPPGGGLADCHLKKPIRLIHLVWTKNSREDGSGYYFKSKVSIAAEARNFNSTLVTSQWLKPKLAEHDLDLKESSTSIKTSMYGSSRARDSKGNYACRNIMREAGYVINISFNQFLINTSNSESYSGEVYSFP